MGKHVFPISTGGRILQREREREVDELARRLSSMHEAGKWGAERGGEGEFGGRRLEREWYPCAKAHWQHPVSSRTSGRTLRSTREGRVRFFFPFPRASRYLPLRYFVRSGGVQRDDVYPKGQCFPNSTTDAIHRCNLDVIDEATTTMHLLFRMKLCYS